MQMGGADRHSERRKTRRRGNERRRDAAEESEVEEEVLRDQHPGGKQRKHRHESRFEPPTAASQHITLQPLPARAGSRCSLKKCQRRSTLQSMSRILERITPEDSDASSKLDSDSDTDASPEVEEPQMEVDVPVQSPVHGRFILWKRGNPQ